MNLRAKETAQSTVRGAVDTAQSTVRALNELVGEAAERVEDVLPKRIEDVLPKRKQKKARRRKIGALVLAAVAAVVAMFAFKRRGDTSTDSAAGDDASRGSTSTTGRPESSFNAFDREPIPTSS